MTGEIVSRSRERTDGAANGWRRVSKIGGAILVLIAVGSACWAGAFALTTQVGGLASQEYVESRVAPVDTAVAELETNIDSVADSLDQIDRRADSLRRDMRAIMWMVCRSDATPSHRRCGR